MGRLEGLFVGGTVRDRRRRYINKAGSDQVEIVIAFQDTIGDGKEENNKHFVREWLSAYVEDHHGH